MLGIKLVYKTTVLKIKCKRCRRRRQAFIRVRFSEITRRTWLGIENHSRKGCIWRLQDTALMNGVLGQATPPSQGACNRFTSLTAEHNHQSINRPKRSLCLVIQTDRCNSLIHLANQGLTQVASSLTKCAIQGFPIRTVRKPTQSCCTPPFPKAADRFTWGRKLISNSRPRKRQIIYFRNKPMVQSREIQD